MRKQLKTNTMDLTKTIIPKSDQLNADDLIGIEKTITITKVVEGKDETQPVFIHFEGDNNKPYKPCKSMRRLLVQVWGKDGEKYVGRSMTLYRDDSVKFAGVDVGGIRISQVSHINEPTRVLITVSRGARRPFVVQPIVEKKKEQLTETHKHYAAIKTAIQDGERTIEQIKDKFEVSEEVEQQLKQK